MSMKVEARELRVAVEALGSLKTQRRYGDELGRRLGAHARRRLAQGESLRTISSSVDVSVATLSRLMVAGGALVPVRVVAAATPAVVAVPRRLIVRGPCGLVVDGATLDDVAGLFARLSSCSG